jgi:4-amino-4-deoxy-L-arabinose transferase-like glycosyltransferase
MKAIIKDKYFLAVLALIIAFIIIKIPYLYLPYYWDEAWVYGPAIRIMEANNLSLLPDALPVYYSRGHPLLFHFLGAAWLRVFGTSLLSSHVFALTISVALITSVYFISKKMFSPQVGLIACLLLILQPIFQAQSVLVLPEVMLSLFSLLALFFFIRDKWWAFFIMATLAVFVKETGIVVIGAAGLWFLIETLFLNKDKFVFRCFIFRSVLLIAPLLVFGAFILLQKQMNGWYFFPEHVNYISTDSHSFFQKMEGYAAYLFIYWGRNVLSSAIIVSLVLYFYFKKHKNNPANKPILVFAIYCVLFLIASSFNFYSDRYTLSMMVPYLIIAAYFLFAAFTKRILLIVFITVVCFLQLFIFLPRKTNSDHNLGYAEAVKTHQQMVNYCIDEKYQHKKIFAHFLMRGNLTNPYCGYLTKEQIFCNVNPSFDNSTELCIFSNMEGVDEYKKIKANKNLLLLKRFESGQAWSELYKVLKP